MYLQRKTETRCGGSVGGEAEADERRGKGDK